MQPVSPDFITNIFSDSPHTGTRRINSSHWYLKMWWGCKLMWYIFVCQKGSFIFNCTALLQTVVTTVCKMPCNWNWTNPFVWYLTRVSMVSISNFITLNTSGSNYLSMPPDTCFWHHSPYMKLPICTVTFSDDGKLCYVVCLCLFEITQKKWWYAVGQQ